MRIRSSAGKREAGGQSSNRSRTVRVDVSSSNVEGEDCSVEVAFCRVATSSDSSAKSVAVVCEESSAVRRGLESETYRVIAELFVQLQQLLRDRGYIRLREGKVRFLP